MSTPSPDVQNSQAAPNANVPALLPYASSLRAPAKESSGEIFRDDDLLIVYHDTTLPPSCILCGNATIGAAIPLTFSWDASFTLTRESTLQLRQEATIRAFLCETHRSRWARGRMVGGVGAAISFSILFAGLALAIFSESSAIPAYTPLGISLTMIGFAGGIFSLFYFTLRTRTLSCKLIRENYVYLEGADAAFLKPFPTLHKTVAPPVAQ